MMHHTTKRGFKDCPGFVNSTGRLGPKRGRKCYITPAFSGVRTKGNKIKTRNLSRGSPWCTTQAAPRLACTVERFIEVPANAQQATNNLWREIYTNTIKTKPPRQSYEWKIAKWISVHQWSPPTYRGLGAGLTLHAGRGAVSCV